jgi:hypothetical protein
MSRVSKLLEKLDESDWIKTVTSSAVWEGPPLTLGADKSPEDMARVILKSNPNKEIGSILRYMQYVCNRAGRRMTAEHRAKIKQAMEIVRHARD